MRIAYRVRADRFEKALRKCLPYVSPNGHYVEFRNIRLQTRGNEFKVIAMDGFRAIDYSFHWRGGDFIDLDVLMPPSIARSVLAILGPRVDPYGTVEIANLHGGSIAVNVNGSEVHYEQIKIEHPQFLLESVLPSDTEELLSRVNGRYFSQMMQGAPKEGVVIKRKASAENPTHQAIVMEWGEPKDGLVRQMIMPIAESDVRR